MNLFYNPSISELSVLIGQYEDYRVDFNVLVDYDGEVIVRSDSQKSRDLRKYKFYISDLHTRIYTGTDPLSLQYLNQLFKNLVYCWEKELHGKMNYKKISRVENLSHWLEIKNSLKEEGRDIISIFFSEDTKISKGYIA